MNNELDNNITNEMDYDLENNYISKKNDKEVENKTIINKKPKKKRNIKLFFIILFITCLICVMGIIIYKEFGPKKKVLEPTPTVEPTPEEEKEPDTFLGKVTNDSGYTIKEGWQNTLVKYMDLYFKSLYRLESQDVKQLFSDTEGNEAYLTQKTIDLLVQHHKLQNSDMTLTDASYDIHYKKITTTKTLVTIDFEENDMYKFKYLDGIESHAYDIDNTIILKKIDDNNYTIESLRKTQDYYIMYTNEVDTSSSNFKDTIDSLETKYLEQIKYEVDKNNTLLDEANSKDYSQPKTCKYNYDRDKALAYAKEYVTKRNTDEYYTYDDLGGNCQNFASQVMVAGGVPMDYNGSYQWKHYSSSLDTTNTAHGRSASFVGTNSFYTYAANNTGYGLCSDIDVNLFYGEPGDEIQVGYKGYSHATVVIGNVKKNNKIIDILINCNTVSLENYPILAYVYPNKRLIKILGYNGN